MILKIVRGIFRVTAATTGLLLGYGIVYAMEGMTVPLPMSMARELAVTTVWTVPWMLLFCSGLDDIAFASKRDWVFWVGCIGALLFVYHFDRYTSLSAVTKFAMPLLAAAVGALPHLVRWLRVLYTICSLVAGGAGLFVVYQLAAALVWRGWHGSFATTTIGALIVGFCIASITTGVLVAFTLPDALRRYRHG